jgi:type IV pilus assembly protein PilW
MRRARGFTLIEVMVAVALGLMATLVISQVFLQSEGNKRATTGGADAQVAGSLALFTIQRDIEMAGYGMADIPDALGCPVTGRYNSTAVSGFQGGTTDLLVPVQINVGTGNASDTVSIWSSGKQNFSLPMKLTENHDNGGTTFVVGATMGVASGDLLVAIPSGWAAAGLGCTVMAATSSSLDSNTNITHATSNLWNVGTAAISPASGFPAGSTLLNLGATPLRRTYSINTTTWSLQVADFKASPTDGARTTNNQFPQIVLLKAMYGMAPTTDGVLTTYQTASPTDTDGWKKVRAVRLVIVARSGQFEKEAVTTASPQWEVGPQVSTASACTANASAKCLTLDVSASATGNYTDAAGAVTPNWQHYRYKVFDTVVPLRNMMWLAGPPS